MEKDPNGPPAEGYPPPQTYHQQQSPDYPTAPQAGYVQPGYASQPGPPGYALLPYGGQPGTYVVAHQNVQPVTHVTVVRNRPYNYLVLAIVVTLCCCLPLGIIGIVFSVDSSNKFDRGDLVGSKASASCAKSWSIAGLVCGIIIIIIWIFVEVLASSSSYNSY